MSAGRVALGALLLALLACNEEPRSASPVASASTPIASGQRYVDDAVCARCHEEIAKTYAAHGMARSLSPARGAARIEDFQRASFYHEPSRQHFAMRLEGEDLIVRRWQSDPQGRAIHVIERRIDWIVGSGNHVRAYLFREPSGELYAAPVNWYTQEGRWGMAPGYDAPDHFGFSRGITGECIACHDAYPLEQDVTPRAARADRREPVLDALPHGIGCQRCHGPGAEHAERAASYSHSPEEIRAAIVNPQRLEPARREEVCLQCHLQPLARRDSIPLLAERGAFDHRAGEALADHRAVLEFVSADERDTFEINHHAYRLRASACREPDGTPLSCLLCHDPHAKPPLEQRLQRVDRACARCHTLGADHGEAERASAPRGGAHCADCHLPERRPEDVVLARMTDHRIQRRPDFAALLAPRREENAPAATTARPLDLPGSGPAHEEIARLASAREGLPGARERLASELSQHGGSAHAWTTLGLAEWRDGAAAEALRAFERALSIDPLSLPALQGAAGASLALQRAPEAEAFAERALRSAPDRPDPLLLRARARRLLGREQDARADLRRCLELRPLDSEAWVELGALELAAKRYEAARDAYQRALEAEPRKRSAYAGLAAAHERLLRPEKALATLLAEEALLPEDHDASLRLAALRLASPSDAIRDLSHGIRCAERAARLEPADPVPHLWIAFAELLAERRELAARALDRARMLGADESTLQRLAALLARQSGQLREAEEAERRADATRGETPRAPLLRALLERAARR
ncbi:MAG: hypothetical protein JNM84_12695 [Planctomycetes bacterium]|nr:hypothetical protein [Planctomycetota bacterium]